MERLGQNISVCMATFNGERFIKEQIESILIQLGSDDELIISDDNSTDATIAIIGKFVDDRIRLITNQGVKSVTYNFENALRNSSGDLIFLSDQDDVWFPKKIETMKHHLSKYDLVMSNCNFIDEKGESMNCSFFDKFHSGPGVLKNFLKNTFLGNCMAFRRSVLDRALPFPFEIHRATQYQIYQDVWLGLLANSLFNVVFIPEKLSGFRRHLNNASPTEMNSKSPQPLSWKFRGRALLASALLKRIFRIG